MLICWTEPFFRGSCETTTYSLRHCAWAGFTKANLVECFATSRFHFTAGNWPLEHKWSSFWLPLLFFCWSKEERAIGSFKLIMRRLSRPSLSTLFVYSTTRLEISYICLSLHNSYLRHVLKGHDHDSYLHLSIDWAEGVRLLSHHSPVIYRLLAKLPF